MLSVLLINSAIYKITLLEMGNNEKEMKNVIPNRNEKQIIFPDGSDLS